MEKLYNNKYVKVSKIGGGSFGSVYIVKDKNTNKLYAMKKFYLDNLGAGGAKKQYEILSKFDHENIHKAIDMFISKNKNQYLITPYYQNNLYDYVSKKLPEKVVKQIIFQIICGINYLQSLKYIHRDIKPDNILLSSEGKVIITDFDLCRQESKGKEDHMTRTAVTLYYRAPEIFFGDLYYGNKIDIWSIGCVFAELIIGKPIFKGNNELGTLSKIIENIGCPNEENWPGVSNLPNYLLFNGVGEFKLGEMLSKEGLSKEGINMVAKMLSLDPKKRPSCEDMLKNEYFKKDIATIDEVKKIMNLK
jgi:serine/threonine protein kinase